jgi:hypothetical protein
MSVPTGLFIDTPEANDVSLHRLSNDSEMWAEEIITKVKERIPKAASLNMMFKLMKEDETTGTGTGSVIINSTEKTAIVPVIIKEHMLYPLDVMIADNKMLPFTEDFFEAVFLNNNLFTKLEEFPMYAGMGRFENYAVQLNEAIYPPNMGRYAYASGAYNILEDIASSMSKADISNLEKTLADNPKIARRFEKNGSIDVIRSISKLQPVNNEDYAVAARDLLPRNILMVKKMGYDNYSLLSNSDEVFDPRFCYNLKRNQVAKYLSKISDKPFDMINDVDRNGEKILYADKGDENSPYLYEANTERVEVCDEYDLYQVRKTNGVTVDGYVVPKVINFEMTKVPMKIFIGAGMATMQDEIVGVRGKRPMKPIRSSEPKTGQTGTFIYEKRGEFGKKEAVATVPVTISAIWLECDCHYMAVKDLNGNTFTLKINFNEDMPFEGIKRIANIGTDEKKIYHMPAGLKWCPMEGFHKLTRNIPEYSVKTAGEKLTVNPIHVIATGHGYYSVKGLDKFAAEMKWDKTNMPEGNLKFLLASMKVPLTEVERGIKLANAKGAVQFHRVAHPKTYNEKIAKNIPMATRLVKISRLLKCDLIKEASHIDNNQTVDSLLALNFVNPDNIAKFIGYIPQFKATVSALCSTLIASRLGLKEIPEEATGKALYRLIDVIDGLEKLRAINENQ